MKLLQLPHSSFTTIILIDFTICSQSDQEQFFEGDNYRVRKSWILWRKQNPNFDPKIYQPGFLIFLVPEKTFVVLKDPGNERISMSR